MKISMALIKQLLFRNSYSKYGKRAQKKRVNLEYFDTEVNLGDALSPVICNWMLGKKSIQYDKKIRKTRHLMAFGSILGEIGFFDATVWGSGIKSFYQISALGKRKYFQKLDIRCVRGPLTREALIACGYECPENYGDPAVLMPLIYNPEIRKTNKIGVVLHFNQSLDVNSDMKNIDVRTDDYKHFIDELLSCEMIISSSLHGIVLAEAYGIPAVLLGSDENFEMLKYYDWYHSTGRKNVKVALTLDEAAQMPPMELPELSSMQQLLLDEFPYDLWEK